MGRCSGFNGYPISEISKALTPDTVHLVLYPHSLSCNSLNLPGAMPSIKNNVPWYRYQQWRSHDRLCLRSLRFGR